MKNEKSIDSQKAKHPPTENVDGLDASESDEHGGVEQADSHVDAEPVVEKAETDDVASEDVISAENAAPPAHESQDPLLTMTAERDDLKDQLLRALADTENMRRRSEREAVNVRKYGHTPFARDLVAAIDNLARAVESAPDNLETLDETTKSLITGIQLSWTELQSIMEKHGIKRVEPLGEKFDYNLHQAMFEVPTPDQPSGVVLEVVQHGYVLHDRLLRPAMVGVSKAGEGDDQAKKDN